MASYELDKEVSSICSTGLRPHILTGIVLWLMRRHFISAAGIQHPQLKSYIWSADQRVSKILIEPIWKWHAPSIQKRPAIMVKRNALRPRQLGLADGQSLVGVPNTDKVPANQELHAQIAIGGSHTIFAISGKPAQADELGTEIAIRLIQYQQAIQREFSFNRFRVAEIGALARLEESEEHFAVPITVAYTFVDVWAVWAEAPFLKRMILSAST